MQLLIDTRDSDLHSYVRYEQEENERYDLVFCYYGRKGIIDFLKRIYDYNSIASHEKSFEEELIRHTVRNNDYDYQWVFNDERLQWFSGEDEIVLRFICEIFHPVVRNEKTSWKTVFEQINELLKVDGYELYEISKMSNRSIFGYRYYL